MNSELPDGAAVTKLPARDAWEYSQAPMAPPMLIVCEIGAPIRVIATGNKRDWEEIEITISNDPVANSIMDLLHERPESEKGRPQDAQYSEGTTHSEHRRSHESE